MKKRKYPILTYTDENGLGITAARSEILKRRKRIAELYRDMLPRYAYFTALYADIATIMACEGYKGVRVYTVSHDLKQMGLTNNTRQSRMGNNIRKGAANA